MKHINYKIEALLHEGFSMKTLDSFSEGQLNLLYEKVKKETKEVIMTPDVNMAKQLSSQGQRVQLLPPGTEVTEKAVSKKQRGLMGAAYSVEKGDKDIKDIPKSYRKKVEKVVDSMSKKQVKDFASTKDKEIDKKSTKKTESKENIKKLEENILRLIEDHLPPHTTKGELLSAIKGNKR